MKVPRPTRTRLVRAIIALAMLAYGPLLAVLPAEALEGPQPQVSELHHAHAHEHGELPSPHHHTAAHCAFCVAVHNLLPPNLPDPEFGKVRLSSERLNPPLRLAVARQLSVERPRARSPPEAVDEV